MDLHGVLRRRVSAGHISRYDYSVGMFFLPVGLNCDPALAEVKMDLFAVTGPLSELQIAYVSRETLQVMSHSARSETNSQTLASIDVSD